MKTHIFGSSRAVGAIGEQQVKAHLESNGCEVLQLTIEEEKYWGADFIVITPNLAQSYLLEVKTEPRAEQTGNFFFETSVGDKPGWCLKYKDKGHVVICHVLPISREFIVYPAYRLQELEARLDDFYERKVKNTNYFAVGRLVPVEIYKTFAKVVKF